MAAKKTAKKPARKVTKTAKKPAAGKAGKVAKKPGTASDDCTVIDFSPDSSGNVIERPLTACAETGGAGPCWQLTAGDTGCSGQTIGVVPDPAAPAPAWENAAVQCALCAPGVTDAARGCP